MRRGWLIAGGLVLLAGGLTPQRIRGIGSAELAVTIRPAGQLRPPWVEIVAVSHLDVAAAIARRSPPTHGGIDNSLQQPFTGDPILLSVRTTSDDSCALLWRHRRHYQMQAVVVIWQTADGQRQAKAFGLPDLRTIREMVIDIP